MTGATAVRLSQTRRPEGEGAGRLEKVAVRTRIPHNPDAPTDAPTVRRLSPDQTARRSRTEAPVVLGRYRLRRRLGTGGFATVWMAHDERLDREVAVKMVPRERVIGGRFEREARAAARLAHPGIVTLYEAAVDDEGAYLVSELVHGTTLDKLLADGRLSDRDVVEIGIALCDALAHAHAHGVVHRDVKPSNVLIPDRPTTPAQVARLTDFGVARVLGGDSLTGTGDVIGTEAYMAPEQAGGLPAGASADLFSLALVLYEGLSGVNPVRTGGARRRAGMHLPPLRRQRRDLPRELGRAIDLCLRPRPGERGTLDELRAALVLAVGHVGDEPGVAGREFVSPASDEPPARGRRIAWLRLALAGAVTAALTTWLAGLGIATAWPALAGLTGRAHRRAALAATGSLWAALWTGGLTHPAIRVGTLLACGVWVLAALTLPWTRSRRWPALEAVRLSLWAVALGLGTALAAHVGGHAPTGAALLGAFAGALVAFVTRRLAARLRRAHTANGSLPTS
jgi:eukaryotic-like serine/threonine-protein kinase